MSSKLLTQRKAKVSKSARSRMPDHDTIATSSDVSQIVAQDVNQLSLQHMLQLQRSLGNQAVLKLTGNGPAQRPALFRSPMIQRLHTSTSIQDILALDIEKKKTRQKPSHPRHQRLPHQQRQTRQMELDMLLDGVGE